MQSYEKDSKDAKVDLEPYQTPTNSILTLAPQYGVEENATSNRWSLEAPIRPRENVGPVPLSNVPDPSEGRWWAAGSVRICSAIAYLSGPLNVEILAESLNRVMARHEALRTRIIEKQGILWQQS